jgi:hypothetical protein
MTRPPHFVSRRATTEASELPEEFAAQLREAGGYRVPART